MRHLRPYAHRVGFDHTHRSLSSLRQDLFHQHWVHAHRWGFDGWTPQSCTKLGPHSNDQALHSWSPRSDLSFPFHSHLWNAVAMVRSGDNPWASDVKERVLINLTPSSSMLTSSYLHEHPGKKPLHSFKEVILTQGNLMDSWPSSMCLTLNSRSRWQEKWFLSRDSSCYTVTPKIFTHNLCESTRTLTLK